MVGRGEEGVLLCDPGSELRLLRGIIVDRTYDTAQTKTYTYIYLYLLTTFGPIYYGLPILLTIFGPIYYGPP